MNKCFKLNGGIRNRRTVPALRSQSAVSVNSASILLSTKIDGPLMLSFWMLKVSGLWNFVPNHQSGEAVERSSPADHFRPVPRS
jgi:hypothetical protein